MVVKANSKSLVDDNKSKIKPSLNDKQRVKRKYVKKADSAKSRLNPDSKYVKRKATKSKSNSNVNSKAAVARTTKSSEALHLRLKGYSYSEIGLELGFTKQHAFKLVSEAMDEAHVEIQDTARDVKGMELMRLDKMFLAAACIMQESQKEFNKLAAIDRMAKCMERRAKLLNLDEVQMTDPDKDEIEDEFL